MYILNHFIFPVLESEIIVSCPIMLSHSLIHSFNFRNFMIPLPQVAERFIAAVRESSKPSQEMSFFISFDPEDILRQATESTLRHERGKVSYLY